MEPSESLIESYQEEICTYCNFNYMLNSGPEAVCEGRMCETSVGDFFSDWDQQTIPLTEIVQ